MREHGIINSLLGMFTQHVWFCIFMLIIVIIYVKIFFTGFYETTDETCEPQGSCVSSGARERNYKIQFIVQKLHEVTVFSSYVG